MKCSNLFGVVVVACLLSGCGWTTSEKDKAAQCLIVSRYMSSTKYADLLRDAAEHRLSELQGPVLKNCLEDAATLSGVSARDTQRCMLIAGSTVQSATFRAFPDGDSSNMSTLRKWAQSSYCAALVKNYRASLDAKANEDALTGEAAANSPAAMTEVGPGVLRQNSAGLEWTQSDRGRNLGWGAAMQYCRTLDLAGGGWRLPDGVELKGLVDTQFPVKRCGADQCKISPLLRLSQSTLWSREKSGDFGALSISLEDGTEYSVSMAGPVDDRVGALCVRGTAKTADSVREATASTPAESAVQPAIASDAQTETNHLAGINAKPRSDSDGTITNPDGTTFNPDDVECDGGVCENEKKSADAKRMAPSSRSTPSASAGPTNRER